MFVHTCVRFCGVGQGLYTRGSTRLIDRPNKTLRSIEWVYDCGSMDEKAVNSAVEAGASEEQWELEFVVISHLDIDHIQGLPALLKAYRVKRIVLPYHRREMRLLWGLSALDGNVPLVEMRELIDLWSDPAQVIRGVGSSAGTEEFPEIILVPPSNERASDEYPPETLDLGDEPSLRVQAPSTTEQQPPNARTAVLVPSSAIVYFRHWEFLPYVDPYYEKAYLSFPAETRSDLDNKLKDILTTSQQSATTKSQLWKKISELKNALYGAISALKASNGQAGKVSPAQKNGISLIAYFSAINHLGDLAWTASGRHYKDANDAPDFSFFASVARGGLLCTGDAFLKSPKAIASLQAFLGPKRMANIACHQVAHHGSKKNSGAQIHQAVNAPINVFCADPNAVHKHPDRVTVKAYETWRLLPNAPERRTWRPLVNDMDFGMCIVGACSQGAALFLDRALNDNYRFWRRDWRYCLNSLEWW